MKSRLPLTSFCALLLIGSALAQTYDINSQGASSQQNPTSKESAPNSTQDNQTGSGFSWGSSIDVAREARAAQDALKRNDYAAAVSFAERAAKSAPQNADLWFLLGYADRLADHYQASIDAYNHGLKLKTNSVNGMAGLAQTYARMGRDADAEQLLKRVVELNPKDANSLQLAGELMLNSDPSQALDLLKRADALQGSPHTDLLIAHAYERLGQPDEFTRYLNRAKSRAPNDSEVLRAVAGAYRDQGQYDQAIATLQSIPGKTTDVQAELAYTYELAGKQQEAAQLYSRLAKAGKGNISLDLSAAQAWVAFGQTDAAKNFLDDAKRIDPNSYRLHAILGAIAESDNRFADASKEYNLALANLPPNVPEGPLYPIELRLNLYELSLRQEDDAAAKQQLDAALAAINQVNVPESSRPEMLRLRAAIEAGSGNLDAANKDLQEALALAPSNVNSLLNYASLQWKLGQKEAAEDTFTKVLDLDHNNRTALSSLGYLARDKGDTKLAESYFKRAINAHPKDFTPYLALGDLYTAERNFPAAEASYQEAFKRMPSSAMIIAGGANAALEAHIPELAKEWLDRAEGKMNDSPQVSRERERYLTLTGDYAESAKLGYEVLAKLPHDREGAVYLAYDLYYLNRYDEDLALIAKYEPILPDDKDLPLVAGNINAHTGHLQEALQDYTRALQNDPKMATGYANRGFVLNDLREPAKASKDFQIALQLQPEYGEAHLGQAFSDLQLHRPKPALNQLDSAQKSLGKTHTWHLARAEAFRQEQDFAHAEPEYRIALQETPDDLTTQLAYADTLFRLRRYQQALNTLDVAQKLAPTEAKVYTLRAQVHAREGARTDAMHDIQLAEQYGKDDVDILLATGGALLAMGDRDAAMQRFSRALDVPNGDRLGVRLDVAQVFMREGHYDDVRRQLAIGFAEARISGSRVSPEDILEAANIFLAIHDFDLAETYFDKAKLAGANPRQVEIGLANTYVAEGESRKAEEALGSLGPASDFTDDYDYMLAAANLYRQRQDTVHALSSFVQANTVAGQDNQTMTQTAQNEVAIEEGHRITQNVSIAPEGSFAPALEDINVYTLDARILRVTNPALLPPPRHSYEDLAESHYRIHLGNLPVISGFVGESFTTGRFLFPSVNVIQDRNTYDTYLNGGVTPILHIGANSIAFNGGLQFDIRRDTISPVYMSQNLFRQFLYVSTSSFRNWVSFNGSAVREAGPFTDQNLNSRDLSATAEFTVGRPWGHTSLLAGYTVRDLLFNPLVQEYFNTSSYVGLQQKFGNRFSAAVLAEDLRSWRVQGTQYAIAQAFLPGARFEFRANPRWNVQGSFLLSRGEGYHEYDNAQSEFVVAYTRAARGSSRDLGGRFSYPFRFSFGAQQQTFYSFAGGSKSTILPVVHFTLF
ncbi:MAG: tetratricopeptide repeat protein [Candidatus Sulfotelmatobacter sp.]